MAIRFNVGDSEVKRGDVFFIDPFQIIVKEDLRGRHKPPTEQAILDMAESLLDFGQRQAVECRRVEDNRLQLDLGFTRTCAARLIREGFVDSLGNKRQDENFKIKVQVVDCNDELAFKHNIVENAHRNQTSPIDDAFNQARLRDQYGMTDADIARLYRYAQPNVSRLRKLLSLETPLQDMVHDGRLSVQGAIDLLDLSAEKRAEVIANLLKENGKLTTADVREQVRDHILNDENTETVAQDTGKKKKKARSVREIRKYFEKVKEEGENEAFKSVGVQMIKFIKGQCSEKTLTKTFLEVLKAA